MGLAAAAAGVSRRRASRQIARAAAVAAGAGALSFASAGALAAYFTRRVLTPEHVKPDDVRVLDVDLVADPPTVTLARTDETAAPGRYGLRWGGRDAHARLGEVRYADDEIVVRRLEKVEQGTLSRGAARWNQYYYAGTPTTALGLPHQDVEVDTDLGPMPAWYVPAAHPAETWAVLVHGRNATREECLRATTAMHELGLAVLIPTYRNDVGAPADPSGRFHLGDREWLDVESAMLWAIGQGAQRIVLFGWSMGGSIVLQAATRSVVSDRVVAVVLDGPVVDWHTVLDHHSQMNRVPVRIARLGHGMLRHPLGRRLVGLQYPLDLRHLDWVSRAAELHLPILVIHSDQDEFVPNGPSLALGLARPDVVRVEAWAQGRHTKEWNTDPERWERVVTGFVREQLIDAPTG